MNIKELNKGKNPKRISDSRESFYIKTRMSPQFKDPYYLCMGVMSIEEARECENTVYGTPYMTPYKTEELYFEAIKGLVSRGARIYDIPSEYYEWEKNKEVGDKVNDSADNQYLLTLKDIERIVVEARLSGIISIRSKEGEELIAKLLEGKEFQSPSVQNSKRGLSEPFYNFLERVKSDKTVYLYKDKIRYFDVNSIYSDSDLYRELKSMILEVFSKGTFEDLKALEPTKSEKIKLEKELIKFKEVYYDDDIFVIYPFIIADKYIPYLYCVLNDRYEDYDGSVLTSEDFYASLDAQRKVNDINPEEGYKDDI